MKQVAVLLVTYNRVSLLKESLRAILLQSYPINHIIIVDNHSTDTTVQYLESIRDDKRIIIKRMSQNVGGAGGFFEGISLFQKKLDDDYLWIMDDDTIPKNDALMELSRAWERNPDFGFLASNVRWVNGTPAIMNIPAVDPLRWNSTIDPKRGIFFPIITHASFVSIIITRSVVYKVGLPIKEFFIWGDDVEYTERISDLYDSYFVPKSVVVHKTKANTGVDIVEENSDRIGRYYYDVRNRFYRAKKSNGKKRVKLLGKLWVDYNRVLFGRRVSLRWKKISVMTRGIVSGIFFNPPITFIGKG